MNRGLRVSLVAVIVTLTATLGQGSAAAVVPAPIDPGRLPPPSRPAPLEPTEQRNACALALPMADNPDMPLPQRTMGFESVWPLSRGRGQTVAVIDTGVSRHPRLPNLIPGGDYVSNGDGIGDCDAHGTIVAGLIAAEPVPGSGFAGGAPEARIITIRQSSAKFSEARRRENTNDVQNSTGYGNTQTMAMAVRHAADMGATVINISEVACRSAADGIGDQSLGAAIQYAATVKNAVVVAAAGNYESGGCTPQNLSADPLDPGADLWNSVVTIATPAWYDDYVLTVGSVDPDGSSSQFSLGGPWVDVAAPGTGIVSLNSDGRGQTREWITPQGQQNAFDGTSFAAPLVSATAALVRARYPQLTARQVITRIEATAHAPAEGWNPYMGHGVVDPLAAVSDDIPLDFVLDNAPHSTALPAPKPAPAPDNRPRTVALAGTGAIVALAFLGVLASFPLRRWRR
ncbi:type VII secretion-associated serine protease mycosin [Rhodococcus sp. ABRD24]|uniref:type VII secretion-associated serine protease mycosin n=1 Tax=Rhodococcus sp. ABRD24 TaxID=2507582 RepID=UPI00103C5902|nr:type VII secretion-associated serine protease mycosin [Rhodococcus sp. ABRD24]QBJ95515.1 type VII secretion-associated serine protease mycosin [Rhodococcus sp. ABRD24]